MKAHIFFFFKKPIKLETVRDYASTLISDLRCDVSLPESKLQSFIKGYERISDGIQQYSMTKLREFLTSKNLLEDPDAVRLINELQIPDLTSDLKTPTDNIAFLAGKFCK